MDDATALIAGQTKKYNIPLSHFEYKYIQNCTDGKELERIYKELIGGEVGCFPALEQLTLDRIRDIKPNSHTLRKDKAPLDRSALPDDERQNFDDFITKMQQIDKTSLNIVNDHKNNGIASVPIRSKSTISKPTTSVPVINTNGKQKRIVPRSYDEWGKIDKQIAREMNSDNDDDGDDDDEEFDDDEKTTNKTPSSNAMQEKSQRLETAEQHRLNGNAAFKSNNYEKAIDLYTKCIILDNTNPMAYMNRAIAHYKLNSYDASITDCSQVLSKDPNHIKALFRRASCFIAKQKYEEGKRDLDILLTIDEENIDAKNLLKTIPTVQKTKGVRIPITEDDDEDEEENKNSAARPIPTPIKIPIVEVEEEEEIQEQQEATNESIQSMNIDIPQQTNVHERPCIGSEDASPALFDDHFQNCEDLNQFHVNMHTQLEPLDTEAIGGGGGGDGDDDDDDMPLGDEAGDGFPGTMSDDDGHVSHSLNVSPTMDDDDDVPELIDQKTLETPPLTSPLKQTTISNTNNDNCVYTTADASNRRQFSAISNDDYNDLYDNNNRSTISNSYPSYKQNSMSSNPFQSHDQDRDMPAQQRSSIMNSYNDQISSLNFSSTLQNWLRDTVELQFNNRSSTYHEKPWSKSTRPSTLNSLQRDIQKYNGANDIRNTIEASKKMLKNGVLDYHNHADHIVSTLFICANCYLKNNDYVHTIQYTSEALQYNKIDTDALICRAKAFENEKFLLLSYADYMRVPSTDYSYALAQRACEKLATDLNTNEGEKWREKLPQDTNDDVRYLTYIKTKDEFTDDNPFEWYRKRGNQLYIDACYVLSIRCYTYCIELKPDIATSYSNRAACYLKVFESQKAIDDCDKALEIDPNNVRALYRKACAYKMSRNIHSYQLTLKELIKLQPNNQTILAEYYTSRHEQIPRRLRRLRTNPANATASKSSTPSVIEVSKPLNTIEENYLSYDDLEKIRSQKSTINARHQFEQQLHSLKANDLKSQCSLILRLPTKGLFKITGPATSKGVETIVNACRIMIDAEKLYQQANKSSILQFSYVKFCFNILIELATLPRLDSALLMMDPMHRASLDYLLAYFSSISSILTDVNKLDRLKVKD
ncbi:unnamed protein product [Rotaria socialis]|uniref:Uncharacterized protein n=1 Tax=Rotaria socialis TaxID=392032 RepID=A0A817UE64_9BILA|nr:unnamed protein product [Rotaria socialis]CAF4237707.1 unnamed protein product [Rotaria socialis]